MRSKLQRPSRVTGFANVSKPRSVKGWIKVKSLMMSLFEASSSSNVNCDGLPVVARNRVNNGKQYKARSTCLRTVKFAYVVGPVSSWLLKVWASSKARMMRGWLSSVCLETLSRLWPCLALHQGWWWLLFPSLQRFNKFVAGGSRGEVIICSVYLFQGGCVTWSSVACWVRNLVGHF